MARDAYIKNFNSADLSKIGLIFWFKAGLYDMASVQLLNPSASWGGSPVLEAVISNTPVKGTETLLGGELDAHGEILTDIEPPALGYLWLGMRVKVAGNSGDVGTIIYVGTAAWGKGTSIQLPDGDAEHGL